MLTTLRQLPEETQKSIGNVLNAIQQGIVTSSTEERLEELQIQKEELEINILRAQLKRLGYAKELIIDWIG